MTETIPNPSLGDLDEIRWRLSKGVHYTPAEMRADILYLLQACTDLQDVITVATDNPVTAPAVEHAAVVLLQKHLRQATSDLVNQQCMNQLLQAAVTNLQKWLRERHLWGDGHMELLKSVAPADVRAYLDAKKPLTE